MNTKRSLGCLVAIVAAVCSSSSVEAALLYSFESDVEGFFASGAGMTITQDTIGATEGTNSMRVHVVPGPGFIGARTATIPAGLTDPLGVDAILFDLTILPGDEYMGNFSDMGIIIFGDDGGSSVQEQYVDQKELAELGAGMHALRIDLDVSTNGNSFNDIFFSGGPTITLFQFFFNQNAGQGPNADDVIVYIDNIRTFLIPEPTSVALFGVCAMVLSLGGRRRNR